MKQKTRKMISFVLNLIFKIFKVQDNKIVFESGRDLIDGNAKAIYDYIKDNRIDNYKLIWLVSKKTDISDIRKNEYAYYKTLRGYYHIATSKYWLKNQSLNSLLKKKDNQVYIQLFHGNGVMKKMGYDVNNAANRKPLEHVKEWDYYIAHDINDKKQISSSTGYTGKIEVFGMASIDNVIKHANDDEKKKEVLKKLNINNKKKNILYAPTFRDFDLDKEVVNVPIEKLSKLKDYNVIVRLHPLVRNKVNLNLFEYDNIYNGCNYSDINDILIITDILITDYSSVIYEYLCLNKPIVFYPYDYNKYVKLRGGFYVDYKKELPGRICYTEKELLETIEKIDKIYMQYQEKRKKYNKKYNSLSDGKASKRFVDALLDNRLK